MPKSNDKTKDVEVIKVDQVILKIAGSEIKLSPEQAKELRDLLISMFGSDKHDVDEIKKFIKEMKKKEKDFWPIPIPQPYIVPAPYPYWPERPWKYWEPICTWTSNTTEARDYNTCEITCCIK